MTFLLIRALGVDLCSFRYIYLKLIPGTTRVEKSWGGRKLQHFKRLLKVELQHKIGVIFFRKVVNHLRKVCLKV